jgi:hypothetical protein
MKVKTLANPSSSVFRWAKIGLAVGLTFLSGCAFVDYLPPRQGTSAELQSALAKSLEQNLKTIPFDPAGKTYELHVRALGGYQNASGLERYVKSLFREWIVKKGGGVGSGSLRMDVFLPTLGTTATRRDLSYQNIPLYYSERFQGSCRLVLVVRDASGKIVHFWQGGEGKELTDIYLMRILGPFDVPF